VGEIHVHEFMSLDGVIDAPTWTFEFGFRPEMGAAIGALTERCGGILFGRTTYEEFEPAWSTRTAEDDPGAPFFSGTLVRAMLADGLVDELHLFVYPLTRGSGPRLFPEEAAPAKLSLAASGSYENGVVYLAYRPQV
jgi:dihydrofolate reductase